MIHKTVQCKSVCPICGQSAYVGRNYIRYCNHCDIYIDGLDVPVTDIADKQPDRQTSVFKSLFSDRHLKNSEGS